MHRVMEIPLLSGMSLSWLCAAKFQKPPVWFFSQTDFKQLVLDGFQGSLVANTSMILVYICELLLYIFLIFDMCKARMSKLFRCLTSAELNGWYKDFKGRKKNIFVRYSFLHLNSVKLNSVYLPVRIQLVRKGRTWCCPSSGNGCKNVSQSDMGMGLWAWQMYQMST